MKPCGQTNNRSRHVNIVSLIISWFTGLTLKCFSQGDLLKKCIWNSPMGLFILSFPIMFLRFLRFFAALTRFLVLGIEVWWFTLSPLVLLVANSVTLSIHISLRTWCHLSTCICWWHYPYNILWWPSLSCHFSTLYRVCCDWFWHEAFGLFLSKTTFARDILTRDDMSHVILAALMQIRSPNFPPLAL